MGRRGLLVTGAAAALTLGTVSFANAVPNPGNGENTDDEHTQVVRGTLPPGSPDFVYLPVEIPLGVRELHVSYTYERPVVPAGTQGNALDIGIFDERGTELGGKGFRGWSGGARTEFFIRADDATPGYIPGPVRPGTWSIALGPYTVAPLGLAYEVTITLRYGAPGKTPSPVYPPERAKGAAATGTAATAICTPGTRTASAPPPRSPRSPAPRGSTSSTPPSTTRTPRTRTGPTRRATTC